MNNTSQENPPTMLSKLEKYITLGFFVATFMTGLVGNILVLVIVVKKRLKRTVNDVFIMNLAVSDLTLIFFLPLQIYDLQKTLPVNIFLCNFVKPLMTVTFFVSIFTLTSMSVYRCKVILNPFRPEMKEFFAIMLVVLIWLSSFIVVLPLMIITKPINNECIEKWPSIDHRRAYTASLLVLQYILPLLIIAVAYIRIGLDLNRARVPKFSFKLKTSAKECVSKASYKARRRENKQVIKTLATIVVMFAICILPGQVAWMLWDFGTEDQQGTVMIFIKFGLISSVFHSCVNPLIYGTLTRQFRRGYVKYLSYLLCCCKSHSMVKKMRLIRIESATRDDSARRRISTSFFKHDQNDVNDNSASNSKNDNQNYGCLNFKFGFKGTILNASSRDKIENTYDKETDV